MTKFREGDVVKANDHAREYRVTRVFTDGTYVGESLDGNSMVSGDPGWFTLLRRPVRVGDRLRSAADPWSRYGAEVIATETTVEIASKVPGHLDGWTHADGTPIDPPQAATQGAGTMVEAALPYGHKACCWCDDCERWRASIPTPPPMPTVEQLARALWNNDDRVLDFLMTVADHRRPDGHDSERWQRAKQIAWERDEGGWRSEAETKAMLVLDDLRDVLRGMK